MQIISLNSNYTQSIKAIKLRFNWDKCESHWLTLCDTQSVIKSNSDLIEKTRSLTKLWLKKYFFLIQPMSWSDSSQYICINQLMRYKDLYFEFVSQTNVHQVICFSHLQIPR